MWKRLAAAAVAVILAVVGVVMVMTYANGADARALEGMQTKNVLVVAEEIPEGTPAEDVEAFVETRAVPQNFVVPGALTDLDEVSGQVTDVPLAAGEQLHQARFATPEARRAAGAAPLPEEAQEMHQVTVALNKPRALGGNIAPGDRVGVFMSFETTGQKGYVLNSDGSIERVPGSPEDEGDSDDKATINTTHLTIHKVLVVRVQGGFVEPPSDTEGEDAEATEAEETVHVTLALNAPDAERLVFAMEWGNVWLSLEPEGASEDGTGIVVSTIPNEARNVYE